MQAVGYPAEPRDVHGPIAGLGDQHIGLVGAVLRPGRNPTLAREPGCYFLASHDGTPRTSWALSNHAFTCQCTATTNPSTRPLF